MTHFSPDSNLGLTSEQVEEKRRDGRQNTEPEKVTKTTGQILKDNICTLFNLFNVLIAVALALVGAWSNMLFILIIALNTLIGIAQEIHAKRLVDKLSLLSMPMAKVRIGFLLFLAAIEQTNELSKPPESRNPSGASASRRFSTAAIKRSRIPRSSVSPVSGQRQSKAAGSR